MCVCVRKRGCFGAKHTVILCARVLRVSRETGEQVVGNLQVSQLWYLEETAGHVRELVVGGIKLCQTVSRRAGG